MKLLLHIGTEKTGTTLLQQWLYANKAALSQQGVFLSDLMGKPNNRKLVAYFQRRLDDFMKREKVFTKEEKDAYFEGFEASILAELAEARRTHHTMIITSEHFHSRMCGAGEIAGLGAFLRTHFSDIRVICYFREQASMRESLYSTALRSSETKPFSEFHADAGEESYYFNFLKIAMQWSSVFGAEAMECRIYDRDRFVGGDLRRDFLSALWETADVESLDFSAVFSNESLSLLQGHMFRAINRNVPFWGEAGGVNPANAALKTLVGRCRTLQHGRFSDQEKQAFSERFRESNQAFWDMFLSDEPGFSDGGRSQDAETIPLETVAEIVEEITDVFCKGLTSCQILEPDAVVLRDVALKYETGEPLTRQEALALMNMARRVRRWGPIINDKIKSWSQQNGD